MENNINNKWRNDKPTNAQRRAIHNMAIGFRLDFRIPLTKGEAFDEIQRLKGLIDEQRRHNTGGIGMIVLGPIDY